MEPAWEWHVGDPIGLGNDIGAPEVLNRPYDEETEEERIAREEKEKEERRIRELNSKSRSLAKEASILNDEGRYHDGLVFINRALEYNDSIANNWNIKAILLENSVRWEDALKNYDRAIELNSSEEIFKHNKALCLMRYSHFLKRAENYEMGLEKINESLEIFEEIDDKESEDECWNFKGELLEMSNDIPEAFKCYKKALAVAKDDNENKKTYKENRDRLLEHIDNSDITCPRCGNKLKITDNFRHKCGNHFDMPIRVIEKKDDFSNKRLIGQTKSEILIDFDEDENMITCSVCGHLNDPSRVICEECGSDLSDSPDWGIYYDDEYYD
jgi:tetratricopeptide (TPR) repeat protein